MGSEPVVIDGGDRSCVRLLLELRGHLAGLEPGTVVHLIAGDPAAPIDLPAWCHSSGNELLELRRDGDGWVGRVAVRRRADRGGDAPPRAPGPGRSANG